MDVLGGCAVSSRVVIFQKLLVYMIAESPFKAEEAYGCLTLADNLGKQNKRSGAVLKNFFLFRAAVDGCERRSRTGKRQFSLPCLLFCADWSEGQLEWI